MTPPAWTEYARRALERPPMLHDVLARYLWECGVASGMDTDGDTGPEAMIAGMGYDDFARSMVEQVKQLRRDYDEAIHE